METVGSLAFWTLPTISSVERRPMSYSWPLCTRVVPTEASHSFKAALQPFCQKKMDVHTLHQTTSAQGVKLLFCCLFMQQCQILQRGALGEHMLVEALYVKDAGAEDKNAPPIWHCDAEGCKTLSVRPRWCQLVAWLELAYTHLLTLHQSCR
eukprot:scaffold245372_cov18-Tisochrysis_lutea.AAC.1